MDGWMKEGRKEGMQYFYQRVKSEDSEGEALN